VAHYEHFLDTLSAVPHHQGQVDPEGKRLDLVRAHIHDGGAPDREVHKARVAVQVGGDAASERPIRFQKCLARSVFQTEFSGQGIGGEG
jgi:hypothetical protein